MVRNAKSTQDLRSSLPASSPSQPESPSPAPTRDVVFEALKLERFNSAEQEDEKMQRLDKPAVQLCGGDAYSKEIMTKMATGTATCAEQAAFNERVSEARSMPSIQNLLRLPAAEEDVTPRIFTVEAHLSMDEFTEELKQHGVDPLSETSGRSTMSMPEGQDKIEVRVYPSRLALMQDQKRSRMSADELKQHVEQQKRWRRSQDRHVLALREKPTGLQGGLLANQELNDYQKRLMALEQSGRPHHPLAIPSNAAGSQAMAAYQMQENLIQEKHQKHKLMAQEQQKLYEQAELARIYGTPEASMREQGSMNATQEDSNVAKMDPRTQPFVPQSAPSGAALQDFQMQLMLLEQQNKRRLLMARMEADAMNSQNENENKNKDGGATMWRDDNGVLWTEIPHLRDGMKEQALPIRCDIESVPIDSLANHFKRQNSYAYPAGSNSEERRYNEIAWAMAKLNPIIQGNPLAIRLATTKCIDLLKEHRPECLPIAMRARQQPHSTTQTKPVATRSTEAPIKFQKATRQNAAKYCKPFCDFLTDNPTVFHAVSAMKKDLKDAGWTELSERDAWYIKPSGSYFVERNGSSLIAFSVGAKYKSGNGAAILAGHVDALTARLKPISTVPNKAGYLQLGVAPYAGALNSTWWDRDLGIGGRVHIKEGDKIVTKLVKLDWPIARIPTLAPHFGAASQGPFNQETQMVPIIGLDATPQGPFHTGEPFSHPPLLRGANGAIGSFIHTQPPALVKVIVEALGLESSSIRNIVNWELELFDVQPATVGGLNKEFIYAGRIDDKLCSWAALQALIESQAQDDDSSIIKVVGLFDDEEIGSLLRQGARGNFLPTVIERAVGSLADHEPTSDLMGMTYANSFLVSSDVTHAVNPNFLNAYLENHAPHLNVGVAVAADSNGHMTTDSVSTAVLQRCAELADAKLQVFQIRNDSRSGGTVGPMLSSALGVRAIDAGLPQLSMHSIRATTGSLDPGLGVILFSAFLSGFEKVDAEFR